MQEVSQTESDEDSTITRMAESQGISLVMKSDKKETAQENKFQSVIGSSIFLFPVPSGSKDHQMKGLNPSS